MYQLKIFEVDRENQKVFSYVNNVKNNETYNNTPPEFYSVSTHFPAYYNWDCYGFIGYMSDLTFFNKALTDIEILQLYQFGKL